MASFTGGPSPSHGAWGRPEQPVEAPVLPLSHGPRPWSHPDFGAGHRLSGGWGSSPSLLRVTRTQLPGRTPGRCGCPEQGVLRPELGPPNGPRLTATDLGAPPSSDFPQVRRRDIRRLPGTSGEDKPSCVLWGGLSARCQPPAARTFLREQLARGAVLSCGQRSSRWWGPPSGGRTWGRHPVGGGGGACPQVPPRWSLWSLIGGTQGHSRYFPVVWSQPHRGDHAGRRDPGLPLAGRGESCDPRTVVHLARTRGCGTCVPTPRRGQEPRAHRGSRLDSPRGPGGTRSWGRPMARGDRGN